MASGAKDGMLAVEVLTQPHGLASLIDEGRIERQLLVQMLGDGDAVQQCGQLVVRRLAHLFLPDG